MLSSVMLRHVVLVTTDVSEEPLASMAFLRNVLRLLVISNVDRSSPILVTLMMEATRSSGASILTRATRRNIPEDTIVHGIKFRQKG
jgi:hypothetical protein